MNQAPLNANSSEPVTVSPIAMGIKFGLAGLLGAILCGVPTRAISVTLQKGFTPTTIGSGSATELRFTVTNTAGSMARSDLGVVDTLPTGLRIASPPSVGGTCANAAAATIASGGGTTIMISNLQVPAGPSSCTVTLNVTNAADQYNADCGQQAVAFTNSASNVSVSNLTNAVSPTCLIVHRPAVTLVFEELVSSEAIADQYLGKGVQFIGGFTVANDVYGGALTVPSPPNWVGVSAGTQTLRFVDPTNPARLATTDSVAVDTPALSNGCFDAIRMDAFDVQHHLIDTATTPAFTSSGSKTTTGVGGAVIHYVKMTRIPSGCVAPFDNLVFTEVVVSDTIFFDNFDGFP